MAQIALATPYLITMSQKFHLLGITENLTRGLAGLGILQPTEVQEKVIPFLLKNGGDVVVQAQTGTGKTAAFGLPLLMKVDASTAQIQAVILVPTRELAKQVGRHLFRYTKFYDKIFVEVLSGGDNIDRQVAALMRPTHIIVATPGRLLDLLHRKALKLDGVKYLILDEADEMMSMGFRKELMRISAATRSRGSTWMFSATFPEAVQSLVKECIPGKPEIFKIDRKHVVNPDIDHRFAICNRDEKCEFIAQFLKKQAGERGVIFCRTKAGAIVLGKQLAARGFQVAVLQGGLSQKERDSVMRSFQKMRFQFLIATDVAARGIDVEGLAFVVQHQLPEQLEYYTHRSGRTARAGRKGISVTLIEPRERAKIGRLERDLGLVFTECH